MRERQRIRVGDGEKCPCRAKSGEVPAGGVVKLQLRGAAMADHLEIAPQDAKRVAGADGFHAGLFRSEPPGQVRRGVPTSQAVSDLPVGEHAAQEPIAVPLERLRDAVDFSGINAQADDVHGGTLLH